MVAKKNIPIPERSRRCKLQVQPVLDTLEEWRAFAEDDGIQVAIECQEVEYGYLSHGTPVEEVLPQPSG
jgi:hypothetical protein